MRNTQKYILWSKAFIAVLLLVFVVRMFWAESFRISSTPMDGALIKGDRVIVNKTAYGLRLPITPLSIPFTFDDFFGWQSYITTIQFPYKRIGRCKIPLNDVVVYNHSFPTDKPLDKRHLCMGRCVAQPGDTIRENAFRLLVKKRTFQTPSRFCQQYTLPVDWKDTLMKILHRTKISTNVLTIFGDKMLLSITKSQIDLISEQFSDSLFAIMDKSALKSREVIVPRKGWKINLDKENALIYSSLILQEQGKNAVLQNNKLIVKGKPVREYVFTDNYYCLLSDNQVSIYDLYRSGFISEKNIVGKASFIWYSANSDGISWHRIFSEVK